MTDMPDAYFPTYSITGICKSSRASNHRASHGLHTSVHKHTTGAAPRRLKSAYMSESKCTNNMGLMHVHLTSAGPELSW